MLSISQALVGRAHASYYTDLGREDYYLSGGEPPGQWMGNGQTALNVTGEVNKNAFLLLFAGHDTASGKALTQNSGNENRRGGWDLTFSAPKSVSAAWALLDPDSRKAIEAAQSAAVAAALEYIESGLITRRGKGGLTPEAAKVAFATFLHTTSRAQEPQIHTHSVLLNIGVRADGTTGTLEVKEAFLRKMAAGALYRAELAKRLQTLGFTIERTKDGFEIKGVSQKLIDHWSTRRKEVKAELKRIGKENAKDAAGATLRTRERKACVPRGTLFERWQEEARQLGIGLEEVLALKGEPAAAAAEVSETFTPEDVVTATKKAMAGRSMFHKRDFIREIALIAVERGIGAEAAHSFADWTLESSEKMVRIGINYEEYTTKELLELEDQALFHAQVIAETVQLKVAPETIEAVFSEHKLTTEQETAARYALSEERGLAVIQGLPGVGKSYTLKAVREVYEANGCEVVGAVLQGKAARGLEADSGIKTQTIARTLMSIEKGELVLHEKSVLVLDEAGMVGTEQMAALLSAVSAARAKIILVGDEEQLQSIEAGGMFGALQESFGSAEIKNVFRQKEEWARQAVMALHAGDAERALLAFKEKGLLRVTETREEAVEQLIEAWAKECGGTPELGLILGSTRAEVKSLNSAAQSSRIKAGILESGTELQHNNELFYVGDRIVVTKNSKVRGVSNGDFGEIKEINYRNKSIKVRFDDGKLKVISLTDFEHVTLGYATTTHKSQGATVEKTYILGGGPMLDKHMGLVQASRAKGETKIFLEKDEDGGIEDFIQAMGTSRKKLLAGHELAQRTQRDYRAQQLQAASVEASKAFEEFHKTVKAERYRIRCEKVVDGKRKIEEYHHKVNYPTGLRASDVHKSLPALKAREQEGWQVYIEPIDRHDDFLVIRGVTAEKQALFEEHKCRPCVTIKSEIDERMIVVRMRRSGLEERGEAKKQVYEFFNKRFGRAGIPDSRWITFPGFTDGGKATEVIPGSQYGCEMVDAVRKDFAAKISKNEMERRQRIKAAVGKLDGVGRQVAAHCLDVLKRRKGRPLNATQFDLMVTLRLRALGRTKEEARRGLMSVLPVVRPSAEQSIIEERVTAAIEVGYSDRTREKVRRLMAHRERYQRIELELVRGLKKGLER